MDEPRPAGSYFPRQLFTPSVYPLRGSSVFEVDDVEVALTGAVRLSPGTYQLFVQCQVTDGDTTTTADNGDLTAIALPA